MSVIENYVAILRQNEYLRGKLRTNALSGITEVCGVFWNLKPHSISDEDLYNIRLYISKLYEIRNKEDIKQAVSIVASENSYHPVVDMLKSFKWDGVQRIKDLFPRYLGAERSEYTTEITTVLLHGAIQRVLNPGVKFDYCIILADKHQGTGKSTMCRFLALNDAWFTDQLGNLARNKEAFEAIRGHWIIELGEMLATRKTRDVESIKAYISRKTDGYRTPYGIYQMEYPRQCIFIGTSNNPQFLPSDLTGNRRFIPLLCDGSRAEVHPLDNEAETREFIRQCYAEAMVLGERDGWRLTVSEKFEQELDAIREQSTPDNPHIGIIQEWLDSEDAPKIVCSKMIWDRVFCKPLLNYREPSLFELQDISDIMNLKVKGWEHYRGRKGTSKDNKYRFGPKEGGYGVQRAWQRAENFETEAPEDVLATYSEK